MSGAAVRCVSLVILALIVPVSAAADAGGPAPETDLAAVGFSTPAQFVGSLEVNRTGWALMLFQDSDWSLAADLGVGVQVTRTFVGTQRPTTYGSEELTAGWQETARSESVSGRLDASGIGSWSAVFVRAEALSVRAEDSALRLAHEPRGPILPNRVADERVPAYAYRPPGVDPGFSSLSTDDAPAASLVVEARGVRELELRGTRFCDPRGCAENDVEDLGFTQTTSSEQWKVGAGTLDLRGRDAVVLLGSDAFALSVDGFLRLPDLRTDRALSDLATVVDGETLRGEGRLRLDGLRAEPDGSGYALMSSGLTSAHLDESPVSISAAPPVAITATALAALLLWKGKAITTTLAGLFTRMDSTSALLHPNRRILFDYVDQNPGATFRELMRETRLAAGTMRHHLAVLMRCGVLVERVHGQTMRYFHQEQDHGDDWDAVVVLRQPDMDRIYRWLLENPGVMQRTVLDEAENWGWSRSTTQHRLKRLVDNDLARVRDLGRSKSYRARPVSCLL